jgi:hypothetical protein
MKLHRLFVLGLCLAAAQAMACVVPVFRYALERWEPDPFRITLLHRNADEAALRTWALPFVEGYVDCRTYNLETDGDRIPESLAAVAASVSSNAPMAFLQFPEDYGTDAILATQAVNQASQAAWLHSPAREELAKRILAKDSTVWIHVLGQNNASNQAVRAFLEKTLNDLAGQLEIPEGMLEGLDDAQIAEKKAALPIRFSILDLDPEDPREAVFFAALRAQEPDLYTNRTHGVVIPAFGQGRALGQFPAQHLTEEALTDMCYFLTGSCSCEVKELNPGFDLFMPRNWFEGLDRSFVDEHRMAAQLFNPMSYVEPETVATNTPPAQSNVVETAALPAGPIIPYEPAGGSQRPWRWVLGLAAALLAGGGYFLSKRGDA